MSSAQASAIDLATASSAFTSPDTTSALADTVQGAEAESAQPLVKRYYPLYGASPEQPDSGESTHPLFLPLVVR